LGDLSVTVLVELLEVLGGLRNFGGVDHAVVVRVERGEQRRNHRAIALAFGTALAFRSAFWALAAAAFSSLSTLGSALGTVGLGSVLGDGVERGGAESRDCEESVQCFHGGSCDLDCPFAGGWSIRLLL